MNKLNEFKEKYPDIYQAILDEGAASGREAGYAEGEAAGIEKGRTDGRAEGATAERERIRAVEDQQIPGHEDLIQEMKFDGETTGEQAAVRILRAEKAQRESVVEALAADGINPVDHVPAPESGENAKSRSEFNKMDPADQAAYVKDGGTVVD